MVAKSSSPERIEAALRAVIPPAAKLRVVHQDASACELELAGTRIRARWVGPGWLRQVRLALEDKRKPDVLVATQMSPGARQVLAQHGIGWVDELGAAEIAVGTVVVSKSGRAPERPKRKTAWTPGVVAVAEALLCGTAATVSAAEDATGLATGTCTHALRVLTDLGLLTAKKSRGRDSARAISDRDQLLDAYAVAAVEYESPLALTVGVTWRDASEGLVSLGQTWTKHGIAWAVSGALAANALAPLLTSVTTAEVYVSAKTMAELDAVATRAGLRPIEGGRLRIAPFPTVTTERFATRRNDLVLAPWPRVFADLRHVGVRGEEAAEHLREVMHGR